MSSMYIFHKIETRIIGTQKEESRRIERIQPSKERWDQAEPQERERACQVESNKPEKLDKGRTLRGQAHVSSKSRRRLQWESCKIVNNLSIGTGQSNWIRNKAMRPSIHFIVRKIDNKSRNTGVWWKRKTVGVRKTMRRSKRWAIIWKICRKRFLKNRINSNKS